jgi:hypothetical protein
MCDKLHILERHKVHLCNYHAVIIMLNHLIYTPHLSDYLGKGEMLSNRDVNKFVLNIFVRMEHF